VLRGEQVVGEGEIVKIQVGKQAVKEVAGGTECGIEFSGKAKIEVGDTLETYHEESKARILQIDGIELR
jgi:translation initiation factor IF-2